MLNSNIANNGGIDVSAGKTATFFYACRPRCFNPGVNGTYEFVQFPFVAKNVNYSVSISACVLADVGTVTPTVAIKNRDSLVISWPTMDLNKMCNAGPRTGTITFA